MRSQFLRVRQHRGFPLEHGFLLVGRRFDCSCVVSFEEIGWQLGHCILAVVPVARRFFFAALAERIHRKIRVVRPRKPAYFSEMNDYARIAKTIEWMDSVYPKQPTLAELAKHLNLSDAHFHRLFSSWAGVTPKAFLSCTTHAHARALLAEGRSVLDAALDAGLSGPGRLHDLCVNLEAATPGEIKSGGAGWTISYGFAQSPFGQVMLAENERGVCHLSFMDDQLENQMIDALQAEWPRALLARNNDQAKVLAEVIFCVDSSVMQPRRLKAYVRGTAMQVKVWQALLRIPSGRLTTYGALAEDIGNPKAARAVGTAIGSNSIAYLIPCHRVIRKSGAFSNYRWGVERKRMIIATESAQRGAVS